MTLIHKLTSTHEISESEKSKCPIKLSPIFAEFFARVKIPIFSPFLFFIWTFSIEKKVNKQIKNLSETNDKLL